MADKKISEFLSESGLSTTDEFTFVRNNTNFKTTLGDLITAIGTLGELSSIGDAAGIPILNQPTALTNEIRKAIGAKGVITSLSPGDGLQIAGNFVNGSEAGAVGIIQSLTSDQTLFRSIEAGQGIAVTEVDDSIRIATTATPASTEIVLITQESDFPIQDPTTITLEAGKAYEIANKFSTSKTIISNQARVFSELPIEGGAMITYTGSGSLFSITNSALELTNLALDCSSGSMYTLVGDGAFNPAHRIIVNNVIVDECVTVGTSTGEGSTIFELFQVTNLTGSSGITFSGNSILRSISRFALVGMTSGAIGLDFGASVSTEIEASNFIALGDASAIAISGVAANANLVAGGLGTVEGGNFAALTSPIQNILTTDARWRFFNNTGVKDSFTDCLLSFQTPTTTTISGANTPTLITGTWVVEKQSQMTGSVAGRATSNIETEVTLPVSATVSIEPVSGSNKTLSVYIAKNGTEITGSRVQTIASSSSPQNIAILWQDDLDENDYFEVFIENNTDAIDIQTNTATLKVN